MLRLIVGHDAIRWVVGVLKRSVQHLLCLFICFFFFIYIFFPQLTYDIYDDIMQVETAIFAMSFKKPLSFVPPEFDSCSCQLDLVFIIPFEVYTYIDNKHVGVFKFLLYLFPNSNNLLLPLAHAHYL